MIGALREVRTSLPFRASAKKMIEIRYSDMTDRWSVHGSFDNIEDLATAAIALGHHMVAEWPSLDSLTQAGMTWVLGDN